MKKGTRKEKMGRMCDFCTRAGTVYQIAPGGDVIYCQDHWQEQLEYERKPFISDGSQSLSKGPQIGG